MRVRVDAGYFPRGESVLRRVHGARIVGFAYGQRALIMQATHPLAFAGLMANTNGAANPFERLAPPAETMGAIFFGTRAGAHRPLAPLAGVPPRVRGSVAAP